MRGPVLFLLASLLVGGAAFAESGPSRSDPTDNPNANHNAVDPAKRPYQHQPQGPTGPTDTTRPT